ncbi:MAG: hypothetical protein ACLVAW_22930 [Eisenbergiella massiliensis]
MEKEKRGNKKKAEKGPGGGRLHRASGGAGGFLLAEKMMPLKARL